MESTLSLARPRPLLSKVKSVSRGSHPWGMAHRVYRENQDGDEAK